ncbi:DUF3221 domain-containing protein [Candidatus Solincola tengchongensis]|uniref:DUF3221 domain-containing protein n=1 Tax=Candidatus Solincola tengchongensis TaxID=2900693 RepID=UPI00257F1342|nr:DUF3221 domain-containing protein [Candidatus Solincola tengchongensis]
MRIKGLVRVMAVRAAVFVVLASLALSFLACGPRPGGNPPSGDGDGKPPSSPDIRGYVTQVAVPMPPPPGASDTMVGKVLVEGELEEDTRYDRAWVTVMPETRIYRVSDGSGVYFNDLEKGVKVEVFFTGPVMESYPVQATASEIRILD